MTADVRDELVRRLIRFVLAKHANKYPVKHTDLTNHVLADSNVAGKAAVFKQVFAEAQATFRNVLACEMVVVTKRVRQKKGGRHASQSITQQPLTQTLSQSQGARPPSAQKAYVLVSTLPQSMRTADDAECIMRGFLSVLMSIILLSPGCRIEEAELSSALERAAGITIATRGGHSQLNGGNTKELLETILPSQWYIELERNEDQKQKFYYIGPRLLVELGDDEIASFVQAVYNVDSPGGTMSRTAKEELRQKIDFARGIVRDGEDTNDEVVSDRH